MIGQKMDRMRYTVPSKNSEGEEKRNYLKTWMISTHLKMEENHLETEFKYTK